VALWQVGSVAALDSGAIVGLSLTEQDFGEMVRSASRDARTQSSGGVHPGVSAHRSHCVPREVTARKRARVELTRSLQYHSRIQIDRAKLGAAVLHPTGGATAI